jgi:hypothetical protein
MCLIFLPGSCGLFWTAPSLILASLGTLLLEMFFFKVLVLASFAKECFSRDFQKKFPFRQ